ncbi:MULTISPECIES: YgfZ/GcvT domain-containing protein [Candidatus Ichthyocystis]|uniref:Putative glycine cleavage system T protein n=1 Tax=Candidatus Ichthyocystis hellenicum TaxID=1561003 RepID=A0A0S4M1S9_9BURK|nr:MULTISPECIES: folate-binding protein YgfZ [Ichthyocystis]CUT17646.1 putative glycine cleavage system T protein [Candidatus Ichthyocystis hellenicum]
MTDFIDISHENTKKVPLNEFSHIFATGPDAIQFLHNQFTNDLLGLMPNRWQLSSWCNHKGRIKTIMWIWKDNIGVHMIMPQLMEKTFLDDIKRYILRAKITIEPMAGSRLTAIIGPRNKSIKTNSWEISGNDIVLYYNETGTLHISPDDHEPRPDLPYNTIGIWNDHLWQCGYVWIHPSTYEKVIPQSVGLKSGRGLSFEKGCYPGQEVIARTHYKGQSKRSLYQCHIISEENILIGTQILSVQDEAGTVMGSSRINGDRTQKLLCVLIDEKVNTGGLSIREDALTVIKRIS